MSLVELHSGDVAFCLNIDQIIVIRPEPITGGSAIAVMGIEQPLFASESYDEVLREVRRVGDG